jgi:hypothetical protein
MKWKCECLGCGNNIVVETEEQQILTKSCDICKGLIIKLINRGTGKRPLVKVNGGWPEDDILRARKNKYIK